LERSKYELVQCFPARSAKRSMSCSLPEWWLIAHDTSLLRDRWLQVKGPLHNPAPSAKKQKAPQRLLPRSSLVDQSTFVAVSSTCMRLVLFTSSMLVSIWGFQGFTTALTRCVTPRSTGLPPDVRGSVFCSGMAKLLTVISTLTPSLLLTVSAAEHLSSKPTSV